MFNLPKRDRHWTLVDHEQPSADPRLTRTRSDANSNNGLIGIQIMKDFSLHQFKNYYVI